MDIHVHHGIWLPLQVLRTRKFIMSRHCEAKYFPEKSIMTVDQPKNDREIENNGTE